ncbi:MAG: xylulokinase [Spirochaeta sp.]
MHTQLCLAVDIGTSSIKAGIVNDTGELVSSSRSEIHYPEQRFDRLHPEELLRSFMHAVTQLELRGRVSAISISGNGPTLIPVDAEGKHLDCVLMWLDKRDKRMDSSRSFFLPKVAWLKTEAEDIFGRTAAILSCAEYIAFRLTGCKHTASPSPDFDALFWDDEDLQRYQLPKELFPSFLRPGEIVGPVSNESAREMGLPDQLLCVAAGSDFLMSLLGTGAVDAGIICDRAGSSEGINFCSEQPLADARLRTLPHIIPGLWNVAGILSSTGLLFEWFRRFTGMHGVSYHDMLHMILGAKSPSPWFFPTLHAGASWEFHHGMFYGLGADHGAAEMGRAVVESIGFAVRETVDILRSAVGEVSAMRSCGGQARNTVWNQMKADISGMQIDIPEVPEAELLGSAACCFTALGVYRDIAQASRAMVRISRQFYPDSAEHDRYTRDYQAYNQTYAAFRHAAAQFAGSRDRFV